MTAKIPPPPRPRENYKTATMYTRFLNELIDGECSAEQLSETSCLHKSTVQRLIRAMRESGRVYLAAYDRHANGQILVPLYRFTLVPMKDARRPPRVSNSERARRARLKKRPVSSVFNIGGRDFTLPLKAA